jgi:hypothetical protein
MNITQRELIENINEIESTGLFSFVAVTTKSPVSKDAPANLREVTVYFAGVVSLGNDYQAAVNARLEKEGKAANFKAKGTYCHPVSDNRLLFKHNVKNDYYFRVYPNLAPTRKQLIRIFDADGVEVTANWSQLRDLYFQKKDDGKSQGLDNPIIVRNYSLKNVKYLKRGEVHLDKITAEIAAITSRKV